MPPGGGSLGLVAVGEVEELVVGWLCGLVEDGGRGLEAEEGVE